MSRLSEISFEPLEPYDGKLSCTVLRGERGSNAPDLPDITDEPFPANHYRQLNTEIYGIYTGLSETIYYTQRLFS